MKDGAIDPSPVCTQYLFAEPTIFSPENKNIGKYSKTIFRNTHKFERAGIHFPIPLSNITDQIISTLPGGQVLDQDPTPSKIMEAYKFAQINHYRVKSAENYLIKYIRGRPNIHGFINPQYYLGINDYYEAKDHSILRYQPQVNQIMDSFMTDPKLKSLHEQAIEWHKTKIESYKTSADFGPLFEELCQIYAERNEKHALRMSNQALRNG